ncbi:uncharacterized protein N7479_005978 [Penicillium vulpinum]|uniref:uncharacterized protein n=1 Tax=Penicillium vulpinum TaxID=29845 RepID=UPI0025478D38|nr:uncharacterized protein N7479_005978 [Penicillium vulpinum]KAJ5958828.1 hypothetical protein N7479_005978 [Penicillium vulpinum]
MPAAATLKSLNVCANCKARKKRCDKSLPRCRYCAEYHAASTPTEGSALASAASHQSQSGVWKNASALQANNPVSASTQLLFDSLTYSAHIPGGAPVSTIEFTICVQAQRLLETTGLYLDEISVRYFQGVHTFVPIISRRRFHAQLLSFGTNLQADFALLVLCIALLVSSADSFDLLGPQGGHRVEHMTLYVAAKSLMAQAQALHAPTTSLVQAGVLLAVYEYAHGHPEQAFVTIGSYARMAYAAQLRSTPTLTRNSPPQADWTIEEEEINTWWGIRICERAFLCELATLDQPLGSVIPAQDDCLPLDPTILDQRNPAVALASRIAIKALNSPGVGGFGRSAQAAWLLDGVLLGLSMTDPDQKHAYLSECDRKLQSFLAVLMQQHGGNYGIFCVPIALTIRSVPPQYSDFVAQNNRSNLTGTHSALFLLHWHLLGSHGRDFPRAYDSSNSSHQALDTITKMVIDIAATHENLPFSQIDHFPPSCLYINRAALKHIYEYQSVTADHRLQTSLSQFEARWGASPSVPGRSQAFQA